MSYPKPYKQLIGALIAWGIDPAYMAVGGGFARDTHHGVEPNDLDIVVVGGVDPDLDLGAYLPPGWEITQQDVQYPESGQDFEARLEIVIQLRWAGVREFLLGTLEFGPAPTLEADILVATPHYKSVNQHITDNDFNLNHYRIDSLGFLNDQPPYFVGVDEGTLVQCRTAQVLPERHNRMVDLAKEYGWSVNIPYKEGAE